MFGQKKKLVRLYVLAALSAGFVLGAGVPYADASNGAYTVQDPDEYVTNVPNYSGETGGNNPTAVIYIPSTITGGTVKVMTDEDPSSALNPFDTSNLRRVPIKGEFRSTSTDTGTTLNSSGIQFAWGHSGTENLTIADKSEIDITGSGPRLYGGVVYSEQSAKGMAASATNITLKNDEIIKYEITGGKTTDASVYGIYNSNSTLTTGTSLTVGVTGNVAADSMLSISGIFNREGGSAAVGSGLKLQTNIVSAGKSTGVVSGIDSGKLKESLNHFKLADNADVSVIFTGKGVRNSGKTTDFDDNDYDSTLTVRSMYLANSDIKIGNNNTFKTQLANNSTAAVVAGTTIRSSKGTLGDELSNTAWVSTGASADTIYGVKLDKKSEVTAGTEFVASATNNGSVNNSYGLALAGNSTLQLGKKANIRNQQYGDGTDVSTAKERLAAAVDVSGSSVLTVGDHATIETDAFDKNITNIANINIENSRMTVGKNAKIGAFTSNLNYDANSKLYGVNVFKTNEQITDTADISIGENSNIVVKGNNMGTIVGLKNSILGTASLGDHSTILVAQTSAAIKNADDVTEANIKQGSGSYIAGYMGLEAGKTTFGKDVSIKVSGNTATSGAFAYGSDNRYGALETGDHFSVTVNTRGYADSYGLGTWGAKDNAGNAVTGSTSTGNNLTVNVTSDKTAYGINNFGNNGIAKTSGKDDEAISVNANAAVGIYSSGSGSTVTLGNNAGVTAEGVNTAYGIYNDSQSAVTLGDNAVLSAKGSNTVYGIFNQGGSTTTLTGAAEITSKKGNDLSWAAASLDDGSLVDITGAGTKKITGNLYSGYNGKLLLTMATGDSFLTGMSKVNNGTTNIDMSNGSLWNMTDSSAVTNLTSNSGATVDMTYNRDKYTTLTVTNFSGNDGVFNMKSDLDSETYGDKMFITSAAAGSSGLISVYDRSLATGSEVTGVRHLLMVTDASKNATFSGKSLNTGGLWDITPTIERGGTFTDANGNSVGSPDEWYLVKTVKKANEDTTPIIDNIDNTYGLYRLSIDTLRQRLGDLRYRNRSDDKYDFWVRDRHGRFDGNEYDSKYNFLQVGVDTMPNEKSAYGFLVERGIASPNFDTGSGKNHTLAGALYATWIGDHGNYTDIVAKIGRNDTTLHTYGAYADKASYREDEKSLSFEYGRTLDMGDKGYFFEPQAQIVFGHLGSNSYTTRRGTHVHEDSFDSAIGRLGFVLGKKQKNGENPHDFYFKASVLHEFGGDRDYSLRRVNAYGDEESLDGSYNFRDTWYEVGFGGNVKINNNTSFYADVERSFGSDYTKKWQINAGINWSF